MTSFPVTRIFKPQFLVNILLIGVLIAILIVESQYGAMRLVYKSALSKSGKVATLTSASPTKAEPATMYLFTTWHHSDEKTLIYTGTLSLWRAWFPAIRPILFTSGQIEAADAQKASWPTLPERKNPECKGPPLFPAMFIDAQKTYDAKFYGYANADIAFGNGLMETMTFFAKSKQYNKQPYLIIGKRTYFNFEKYRKPIMTPDEVKCLMTTGELIHWSSDFFISSREFPWDRVVPLSIGRPLFCRWIIAFAIAAKIRIIDASRTIEALHLTTKDGNRSSWVQPGIHCNKPVIQQSKVKVNMLLGRVECVTLETYFDRNRSIKVRSRKACPVECPAAYSNSTVSVWDKF